MPRRRAPGVRGLRAQPGFESAWLDDYAHLLGITESRRLIGDHVLAKEEGDVRFPDAIAQTGHWTRRSIVFDVPYRCLTAPGFTNLLATGRCISTTRYVHQATKEIPAAMATGEAAGAAATMAARDATDVHAVDVQALRGDLQASGAITAADPAQRFPWQNDTFLCRFARENLKGSDGGVPGFEGGGFAFVAEDRQRRRGQDQVPAEPGRLAQPPRRQDPQHVTVGEHQRVALRRAHALDHPVGPRADLVDRLAVGRAVVPQEPAGPVLADVERLEAFVVAVVPLAQVVVELGVGIAGERGRVASTRERGSTALARTGGPTGIRRRAWRARGPPPTTARRCDPCVGR